MLGGQDMTFNISGIISFLRRAVQYTEPTASHLLGIKPMTQHLHFPQAVEFMLT